MHIWYLSIVCVNNSDNEEKYLKKENEYHMKSGTQKFSVLVGNLYFAEYIPQCVSVPVNTYENEYTLLHEGSLSTQAVWNNIFSLNQFWE